MDDKYLVSGSQFVTFNGTHAGLDSSVILFLKLSLIKFISVNNDQHAIVEEKCNIIYVSSFFKQLKVSGILFHVFNISSSALFSIVPNNRFFQLFLKDFSNL